LGKFADFDILGVAVFGVGLVLYGWYAVVKRV